MSTNAVIGLRLRGSERIELVSCNWDGYPAHVGKCLIEHYDTHEKIELLLSFGNLSSLHPKIWGSNKHSFDEPEKDVCIFYGRDRGEKGESSKIVDDLHAFFYWGRGASYFYLFDEGRWRAFERDESEFDLSEAIAEEEGQS